MSDGDAIEVRQVYEMSEFPEDVQEAAKLSETPPSVRTAPPTLGQHTPAILTEDLHFTPAEVDTLRAKGII